MSQAWGHVAGVFVVVLMAGFIGLWVWAWLPRHKPAFNELARLPMEDDDAPVDAPEPLSAQGRSKAQTGDANRAEIER